MPQIPLSQLNYDDQPRDVLDKINENFRLLEWLLNYKNLDPENVNPEVTNPNTETTVMDNYGLNAEMMKYYPNKCSNSGFEIFDANNMKPKFWDTTGVVSDDAAFEGNYTLMLEATQTARQKTENGLGLANPAWWAWCQGNTRFSVRIKGQNGIARIRVYQNNVEQPLWYYVKNDKGEDVKTEGTYLDFAGAEDWSGAFKNFACTPNVTGGPIELSFENIGTGPIYIDAITLEADWTGKWPSFYTPGPNSVGIWSATQFLEYGAMVWEGGTATFQLVNGYTTEPVVTASIQGLPTEFSSAVLTLVIENIQETVSGVTAYSKVRVTPSGGTIPTPTNAKLTLHAICEGRVVRT